MNTPTIKLIGWNKPAIELVAGLLLKLPPKEMLTATVVVPTSGSGRRLKEYLAEKVKDGNAGDCKGKTALLMPKIKLVTELMKIDRPDVASDLETQAAWLEVLTNVLRRELMNAPREVPGHGTFDWNDLLKGDIQGDELEWAQGTAAVLRRFRYTLEQECVDDSYRDKLASLGDRISKGAEGKWKNYFAKLDTRWTLIRELYNRVDKRIRDMGKVPQEAARVQFIQSPKPMGGKLIFACVPAVSPQTRLYLDSLMNAGTIVEMWVNAPEDKEAMFDAYGQPLEEKWLDEDIVFPPPPAESAAPEKAGEPAEAEEWDEETRIHRVRDAKAMGRKAVELAASFGHPGVAVVSCDTAMDAAIMDAFSSPSAGQGWKLGLPSGRAAAGSPALQLVRQLQGAFHAMDTLSTYDEATGAVKNIAAASAAEFAPLLRNRCLQLVYALGRKDDDRVLLPLLFNSCLDRVEQTYFPASIHDLASLLSSFKKLKARSCGVSIFTWQYKNYVEFVRKLVDELGNPKTAANAWKRLAVGLVRLSELDDATASGMGLKADELAPMCRTARKVADCIVETAAVSEEHKIPPSVTFCLLQYLAARSIPSQPAIQHEETQTDIQGWREAAFSPEPCMILCGMHSHCIPEPLRADAFLPNALRVEIGVASARSREARDSFLFTALLNSRCGALHVVVAQQQDDGTPIAPSPLLLRCDTLEKTAQRAARLFDEVEEETARRGRAPEWHFRESKVPAASQAGDSRERHGGETEAPPAPPAMETIELLGVKRDSNPYADAAMTFSPSRINDFLTCPLRFWMKTLFALDAGDTFQEGKLDMDAGEYGTAMHEILKEFVGEFPDMAAVQNAMGGAIPACGKEELPAMCDFLKKRAGNHVLEYFRNTFGECHTLALQAQARMLVAGMEYYACIHAEMLQEGWVNLFREVVLTPTLSLSPDDSAVPDAEAPALFSMTADRIDYKPQTGEWRIIDYKSHDNAPDHQYYKRIGKVPNAIQASVYGRHWCTRFPLLLGQKSNGEPDYCFAWKDVQLPLYAYGLQELLKHLQGPEDVEREWSRETLQKCEEAKKRFRCGWEKSPVGMPELCYINMPKTKVSATLNTLHSRKKSGNSYIEHCTRECMDSALDWVKEACRLIRAGECLYSAESLGVMTPYGDFSPYAEGGDPRRIFGLSSLS